MSTEDATIKTERLVLRPLARSDADALTAIGTDDVFEMVPEITTPFDAAGWIEHKLESEEPTICHVVLLADEKTAVGFVQVNSDVGRQDYFFSAGYWFGRDHWGNGYATEALSVALQFLWRKTKGQLRPIYAQVDQGNAASRRVLEKCGFVPSPEAPKDGDPANMIWYRWHP